MHMISPDAPIRLAPARPPTWRPSNDSGYMGSGCRSSGAPTNQARESSALTMVGVPGAGWHLELVADADLARADRPVRRRPARRSISASKAGPEWLARIEGAGGQRVPST